MGPDDVGLLMRIDLALFERELRLYCWDFFVPDGEVLV
jgi:hypothetical protein